MSLKKVIIAIIIFGGIYLLYNHYIAEPRRIAQQKTAQLSEAGLRARQNEARQLLRMAYQKQESYHAQHGEYARKMEDIKAQARGTYYDLEIKRAKRNHFEIRAEGNIDLDGYKDIWMINEDGKARNLVDDVEKN